MEVIILLGIIAVVLYGITEKREKKRDALDTSLEELREQKAHDANADIVSYGQVQERKAQLFDVINQNLDGHPEQSAQLKDIVEDWAALKIESFENRRSWVRSPGKSDEDK